MFTREDLIAFSRRKTFQSYNDRLTINNSAPNSSSGDTPGSSQRSNGLEWLFNTNGDIG